jgi:hypothetical protein
MIAMVTIPTKAIAKVTTGMTFEMSKIRTAVMRITTARDQRIVPGARSA